MTNMELQFQMAIRDQVINDQREALSNLWSVLECSGLNHDQILEIAAQQGIMIEEGIMPSVIRGRTYTSATPIPALHKSQPTLAAATSARFPSLGQLQTGPDAISTPEYRNWGNRLGREELDTVACCPKTVSDDWKGVNIQESGGHAQLGESPPPGAQAFVPKTAPDTARTEGVGLGQSNGESMGFYSPDRLRAPRDPWPVESACPGRNSVNQDHSNYGGYTANGSSLPAVPGPKVLTPPRVRRRPRSAESRQHHWSREWDGSTTGVDAGSEGSDSEDSDHCWHESQEKYHQDRFHEGSHQAIDNESLRRVRHWRA